LTNKRAIEFRETNGGLRKKSPALNHFLN